MEIKSTRKDALTNNSATHYLIKNEKYLSNKHFLILVEIIDEELEKSLEKFHLTEVESSKMDRFFPYEEQIGEKFIPESQSKFPNKMILLQDVDGNSVQSKYYWLFVKKMGCELFINKFSRYEPLILVKNNKIVGSIMPCKPLESD